MERGLPVIWIAFPEPFGKGVTSDFQLCDLPREQETGHVCKSSPLVLPPLAQTCCVGFSLEKEMPDHTSQSCETNFVESSLEGQAKHLANIY